MKNNTRNNIIIVLIVLLLLFIIATLLFNKPSTVEVTKFVVPNRLHGGWRRNWFTSPNRFWFFGGRKGKASNHTSNYTTNYITNSEPAPQEPAPQEPAPQEPAPAEPVTETFSKF